MSKATSALSSSASSYSIFSFCPDRKSVGKALQVFGLYCTRLCDLSVGTAIRAFATPLRPNEFGNFSLKTVEVARRFFGVALSVAGAPVSLSLAAVGSLVKTVGNCLVQDPYYHLRGNARESAPADTHTFLTLNACMFAGGLPQLFGGVVSADERIDRLAAFIKQRPAHVVALQEMAFYPARALSSALENQYAHFYMCIGPNPGRQESCLYVASMYPIISPPLFVPFPGNFWMKRGFFCLEMPTFWLITTHLEPGSGQETCRRDQLNAITAKVRELSAQKPCFLLGDCNIPRTGENSDEYSRSLLPTEYIDAHAEKFPKLSLESATCTDALDSHMRGKPRSSNSMEIVDYALLDRRSKDKFTLTIDLLDTFSLDQPGNDLSDHRALWLQAKARVGSEEEKSGTT